MNNDNKPVQRIPGRISKNKDTCILRIQGSVFREKKQKIMCMD